MFETLKSLALGVATALMLTSGAQAAPVTYTIDSTSLTYASGCADGFCNAELLTLPLGGTGGTVDTGASNSFEAFRFRSLLNSRPPFSTLNETLNVTAQVVLNVGGTAYTYVASGVLTGWSVVPGLGIVGDPQLTWTSTTSPAGSPLTVLFNAALNSVRGSNRVLFTTITVGLGESETSVVPLPGGVVLLLTGLLGLLGLSRRKKAVIA